MKCRFPQPFKNELGQTQAHPCGQCHQCRINIRRQKTLRNMLELTDHAHASFLTLTYNDDHLPPNALLDYSDFQKFIKRVRKDYPIRYFACGEYGERNTRPHYHAILYGFPPGYPGSPQHDYILSKWSSKKGPMGRVDLGSVTPHSIQYVCSYISKKRAKMDGPYCWIEKEKSLQSLKPTIGKPALLKIKAKLDVMSISDRRSIIGHDIETDLVSLRVNNKLWPLDRFAKQILVPDDDVQTITGSTDYADTVLTEDSIILDRRDVRIAKRRLDEKAKL